MEKIGNLSKYGSASDTTEALASRGDKKRENWKSNFRYSVRNPYVKTDEDLGLSIDKGVYPYDYFDDFERFQERPLPPKEALL